jgi:thiamine phosphate synthase YjbQ (UPF0047 family)
MRPKEISLVLTPRARFDVIDVAQRVAQECGDFLEQHRKALYCSYHTTAGYLEQSLCARLRHSREHVAPFMRAFQGLFPPGADYRHDQLQLRNELSEEERRREPRNADSHLTFIGSGLRNCVTYVNRPGTPVYFIDLDGIHEKGRRTRRTTVLAYDEEEVVHRGQIPVPVSKHPIDSVNLRDPRNGFMAQLTAWLDRSGIEKGRIDIALEPSERHVGLTVNEYETLLMRHDLTEVLRDPLRLMAIHGKTMLRDPKAIPTKTMDHARYDLVHILNELMDAFRLSESMIERIVAAFMGVPASRFLRMKRSVSLLVSDAEGSGKARIVHGTYQSPILVQWRRPDDQVRRLDVTITRFE